MAWMIALCIILISIVNRLLYDKGFRDGKKYAWDTMAKQRETKVVSSMEVGVKDELDRRANL